MALRLLKVPQMLVARSFGNASTFNQNSAANCCCPESPPKKETPPTRPKCGPSRAKPSILPKVCLFGAKTGIAGGLVYWTYRQGLWSDSESSGAFSDRMISAGTVLYKGQCSSDSPMAIDCCKYGKDENETIQRLKTAYCFLKLDSVPKPSMVQDAVYVGTLTDEEDFCRCNICKPVSHNWDTARSGPPQLKPAATSFSGKDPCAEEPKDPCAEEPKDPCAEEPIPKEWFWKKWSSQNWSPKTCIFSKNCTCGDKTEVAAPEETEGETPQAEDSNLYVDEYFIIRKEDNEADKGKDDGGKGGEKGASKGKAGEEPAGDEEAAGDDGAEGEEEAADEEPAEEEA